jgi:hypothetical protein
MWRSEAAVSLQQIKTANGNGGGGEQSYEMYLPGQQADVLYQKTTLPATLGTAAKQPEPHFEQSSAVGVGDLNDNDANINNKIPRNASDSGLAGSAQGKTRHVLSLPTIRSGGGGSANNNNSTDRNVATNNAINSTDNENKTKSLEIKAQPSVGSVAQPAPVTNATLMPSTTNAAPATNNDTVIPKRFLPQKSTPQKPTKRAISPETAQTIRNVAISLTIFLITAAAVFVILLLVKPPFVQRKCDESQDIATCLKEPSPSLWKIAGLSILAGGAAAVIPFAWKHVGPTVGPMLKMF